MTMEQEAIRIGLIGPTKAGKSSMFQTFHEALDRGRHGFPQVFDPQVQLAAEPTRIEGLEAHEFIARMLAEADDGAVTGAANDALRGTIAPTESHEVVTRHYTLSYHEPGRGRDRTSVRIAITDAAGEHSFGRNLDDPASKDFRDKLYRELARCVGFVVVVPFFMANDPLFVGQLVKWLDILNKFAALQQTGPSALPRPVVIALTRYDALFTEFGCEAFRIAADPRVSTDIFNRLV